VDDASGRFGALFKAAVTDLGQVWKSNPQADPLAMAAEVFSLIEDDRYGLCDHLVGAASEALGPHGLEALSGLVRASLESEAPKNDWRRRQLIGLLAEIADASGDVDGYIAAEVALGDRYLDILGIVERLLAAERSAEALEWLDKDQAARTGIDFDHEVLRVRALERLKRRPEAQAVRWRLFELELDVAILRDYVRALDDFEEFEVLDRAFAVVEQHKSITKALSFCLGWPKLDLAARLVETRGWSLDGAIYELLRPAAEALAEGHPRAATRLYRRMIDNVLDRTASGAYPHAARDLAACAALADRIGPADASLPSHADYLGGLRAKHGRKVGFWGLVK
jgi:hypothetical protein